MIQLDGPQSAQAHSDNHSDPGRLVGGDLEPAVLYRHLTRGNSILDEEIHLFYLFGLDKILAVKVGDLPGYSGGKKLHIGKPCDGSNTGMACHYMLPVFFDPYTQRSDEPNPGYHNSALFKVLHCWSLSEVLR